MPLALASRRGTIAAGFSALAALALAIGVLGRGCRVELLSPDTQRRLAERAQQATSLVGWSVRYSAFDLISIGSFDDQSGPSSLEVVEQYGDKATVEVDSPSGKARVALVKIDGRWRIDLPQYGNDL